MPRMTRRRFVTLSALGVSGLTFGWGRIRGRKPRPIYFGISLFPAEAAP